MVDSNFIGDTFKNMNYTYSSPLPPLEPRGAPKQVCVSGQVAGRLYWRENSSENVRWKEGRERSDRWKENPAKGFRPRVSGRVFPSKLNVEV